MNQLYGCIHICIHSLHREPTPRPTPLCHYRAPSWAPCVTQTFPLAVYFTDGSVYIYACVRAWCHFSCVRLSATLWIVACQALLSLGFSRQEYWSGLPCRLAGDLPDLGFEPEPLCLLHWQAGSLPSGSPVTCVCQC